MSWRWVMIIGVLGACADPAPCPQGYRLAEPGICVERVRPCAEGEHRDFQGECRATFIDYVKMPGCEGLEWVYEVGTIGLTSGQGLVNAWNLIPETPYFAEEATLTLVHRDPEQGTDTLRAALIHSAPWGEAERDVSTSFRCGEDEMPGHMVYVVRAYDVDGNFADCVAFSNGYRQGTRDILERQPPASSAYPVTRMQEISEANCVNVDR